MVLSTLPWTNFFGVNIAAGFEEAFMITYESFSDTGELLSKFRELFHFIVYHMNQSNQESQSILSKLPPLSRLFDLFSSFLDKKFYYFDKQVNLPLSHSLPFPLYSLLLLLSSLLYSPLSLYSPLLSSLILPILSSSPLFPPSSLLYSLFPPFPLFLFEGSTKLT